MSDPKTEQPPVVKVPTPKTANEWDKKILQEEFDKARKAEEEGKE